jgi:hypothetical protein
MLAAGGLRNIIFYLHPFFKGLDFGVMMSSTPAGMGG